MEETLTLMRLGITGNLYRIASCCRTPKPRKPVSGDLGMVDDEPLWIFGMKLSQSGLLLLFVSGERVVELA